MTDHLTIPSTLLPVKRGAATDWKATALAEHQAYNILLARQQATLSANTKLQNATTGMSLRLSEANQRAHDYYNQLSSIRAHWASMFLPRNLR